MTIPAAGAIFAALEAIRGRVEDPDSGAEGKAFFDGRIRIRKAHNRGFVGSFLEEKPQLVRAATAASIVPLLALAIRDAKGEANLAHRLSLAMFLGGAAGNSYERLRYGKVTDYLQTVSEDGKEGRVIFNLADVLITAGAAGMLLGNRKRSSKKD